MFATLPESRGGASGGRKKGTPNRYTYRLGRVQQMIRKVVENPNIWHLAREGSTNRSSLAPTLSKYPSLRFSTRKREDGKYDIYVRYTPVEGKPDPALAEALHEWSHREEMAKSRPV